MRPGLRLATLALVALLAPAAVGAEPIGSFFYLVPEGGYTLFDGSLRFDESLRAITTEHDSTHITNVKDGLYFGGRLGYQWRPWLALELAGGVVPTGEDRPGAADATYYHGSGDVVLTPYGGRLGGPFLLIGGGSAQFKPSAGDATSMGNGELGGGLRFWFSDALGMRLEGRDLMWLRGDKFGKPLAHTITFSAGVALAIGATPRDTDGDGVPDRKDRCPDTPKGATVDATGCPHDADGDKVLDGLDQCPGTPPGATVDEHGCPHDADGDQVWDGLDQCPDTPKGATVDEHGCPHDSDGDGVLDGLDQCPDTPKGATVDERGCPKDSDHDGVPDGIDKCPDTSPGLKVDRDGCSIEVTEKETELLDTGMIRLQNINFETGKAELLPESKPLLDVVGQVLTRWPELRIEIGGHTDSRGSAAANQKLSEARVQAVLDHLLAAFPTMKREQFATKGYGESKPIAPNNTVDGMALNRRVEFVVLNKEVLKREIEKRHLLKQGEGAPADTTKK